jgi:hypothetical protein
MMALLLGANERHALSPVKQQNATKTNTHETSGEPQNSRVTIHASRITYYAFST